MREVSSSLLSQKEGRERGVRRRRDERNVDEIKRARAWAGSGRRKACG